MKFRYGILLSSLLWLWPLMVVAGETSHPETQSPSQGRLLTAGDILITQQHLEELHFNPGPVDGVWHPATTTAIRTLNYRLALARSHNVDSTTLS